MRIDVLTLFPNMINSYIGESIISRAIENKIIEVNVIDFRSFSASKHKKVDDSPYGGGSGMVLSVQPIHDCLISIEGYKEALKIMMTPQGKTYHQTDAYELTKVNHMIILCGHYEGYDERIRDLFDLEISIGDYVLTGGEIGALVLIDSISRLIPNVLNKGDSFKDDSFSSYMLEHPHYTRPQVFNGKAVPDVLLSGNHKEIEKWRQEQSLKRTKERRPDLLKRGDDNGKV
ncbi:tRNA (guanosine(37)-N1)-methyltransferase TrmD [Candidatus Izimaplasma bacterium ZiA1]|uniref:tRNA (guanosine(37)-N1)-methyltransferase TrmD n=1 Tax=Candidatus Izimoplasma sp. ZiA1 TaxID=2024899 RepID=UPI000BAA7620|nr:tRNA (guanosine(37)-N1)-methyltransferase TrmD [Candidatus Izimaplasma bacterium ZiA1]